MPTEPDTPGPADNPSPAAQTGGDEQTQKADPSNGSSAPEGATPAVGFNPIGRLGLAAAREAPAGAPDAKSGQSDSNAAKHALPTPQVIATPDGPVDESTTTPAGDTGSGTGLAGEPDAAATHGEESAPATAVKEEAETGREPTGEAAPSRADSEWDMVNKREIAEKTSKPSDQ